MYLVSQAGPLVVSSTVVGEVISVSIDSGPKGVFVILGLVFREHRELKGQSPRLEFFWKRGLSGGPLVLGWGNWMETVQGHVSFRCHSGSSSILLGDFPREAPATLRCYLWPRWDTGPCPELSLPQRHLFPC